MLKNKKLLRFGINNFAVLATVVILWQTVTIAKNPPLPRERAEVETALSKAVLPKALPDMNIVLLADDKDHGENERRR